MTKAPQRHERKIVSPATMASLLLTAALAGFVSPGAAAAPILVTNGNDSGEGSLRAALEAAAGMDAAAQILVVTEGDIAVTTTLIYDGEAPLTLLGTGQRITTEANVTLLAIPNGADLTVHALDFQGPGGFSVANRGDKGGAPGKGIFVKVRDDQTGTVKLDLENVTVAGFAYHGVHVSDCDLADACGAGATGIGDGSPASIDVRLFDVTISDVGTGMFDADGIRIDERGPGDILFVARASSFTQIGADGIELDEGQDGHVTARVIDSDMSDNGDYCDPDVLNAFLPDPAEAEFADGAMAEAAIPGPVTGSPDDRCFERDVELYPSGFVEEYEFELDLDDGFDIDEAGNGDMIALLVRSRIHDNDDEGMDFDESGEGALKTVVWGSAANRNVDDGFRTSEEGPGDSHTFMHEVEARDNGRKGATFEQADEGLIDVIAQELVTADNGRIGLEVIQEGTGGGSVTIRNSNIADGIDAKGVTVKQE